VFSDDAAMDRDRFALFQRKETAQKMALYNNEIKF
jgi:hypothetical protein